VQTIEGYFFCVVGPVHPADRVIAYLKYVPDPSGKWGRGNIRFKRALRNYTMLDLLETLRFLEHQPEYIYDSPVLSISMSAVPLNRISAHVKPERKLSQLIQMDELDVLQRKLVDVATLISDKSRVPIEYFGVTGSLLLDIHQDFSDIDLILHGMRNREAVKQALLRMAKEGGSLIQPFDDERARQWCLNKAEMYPLTYEEAAWILRRKWGRGTFRGTMFSVHPVKLEDDVSERYGDRIFKPEGIVTIKATVSDDSEADFLPSVYKVEDVKILGGPMATDIYEVASYEGLYGGVAEKDEKIIVCGKLESVVQTKIGQEYHRVVVGSKEAEGQDYIKPI